MDLRRLRYLIAVVEERSVSRAAARLNMSQPPLINAIARMERELGVQLLDRHARGVEPTEAGTYLARTPADCWRSPTRFSLPWSRSAPAEQEA